MKILAVIPARGGSKGIPRKNVRFMAGKPLISYSINCAKKSSYNIDVVVTSEDEEIKNIAEKYGAHCIDRPKFLSGDSVTLDPVINHAVEYLEEKRNCKYDIVITMQPTSPLLSTKTLDEAIQYLLDKNMDTVISGVNDPRLSWREENGVFLPNYVQRLNRQYMPKELKETGAFVITRREFVRDTGRFGNNVSIYEMPERESGDIDTPHDWWVAELELKKKNIIIRVEGYPEIGMGHIYRGLQIVAGLIEHNVCFVISEKSNLGIKKIEQSNYPYKIITSDEEFFDFIEEFNTDIVINDILNTSMEYIEKLKCKGVKVVNFEDLGDGAQIADATINALYENSTCKEENMYWGSDYYLIRDEFLLFAPRDISKDVKEILVVFGGTDPSDLTNRTVNAIIDFCKCNNIHITVILGLGYNRDSIYEYIDKYPKTISILKDVKVMSEYMINADIAISSQGRTMLELASLGIPTIVMAQHQRELMHEFGALKNGYINLGIGKLVEERTILGTVEWLVNCPQIRVEMNKQMVGTNLRSGMERVKKIILE